MPTKAFEFADADRQMVGRIETPERECGAWAVFTHCFTCGADSLAAVHISRGLAKRGIGVLRFDLAGIGRSGDRPLEGITSDICSLHAAVRAMKAAGMPVSLLIGHSLGGIASVEVAAATPGVRGVTTIGTPSAADHLKGHLRTAGSDAHTVIEIAGRRFEVAPGFAEDLAKHSLMATLRSSRVPILILHSPDDRIVDIDQASRIYAAARHPKSFVSLCGADHLLTTRAAADYAASLIGAWVAPFLSNSTCSASNGHGGTIPDYSATCISQVLRNGIISPTEDDKMRSGKER